MPASDCAAPRHDQPVPAETGARLCRPCRLGLARDLQRLPGLHADLEHLLAPVSGGHGGDGSGLPVNMPAADCRDQIRHDLAWWIFTARAELGRPVPPFTIPAMCAWLGELASPPRPWIPFRDWAGDMAGAVGDDRRLALSLLDPWIRRSFPVRGPDGVCPECARGRLRVTVYASEGDRRRSFCWCEGCGHRWEPEQWMRLGRVIVRRRELAAAP